MVKSLAGRNISEDEDIKNMNSQAKTIVQNIRLT